MESPAAMAEKSRFLTHKGFGMVIFSSAEIFYKAQIQHGLKPILQLSTKQRSNV